ncbi:MAG: hypothetical protein IJ087_10975 [Eggerthellaceae bacterium]|nr:hypothetical protein [Eggerthellaceae bacterium]
MGYEEASSLSEAMHDLFGVVEVLDALSGLGLEDSCALKLLSKNVDEAVMKIGNIIETSNPSKAGGIVEKAA